MQDNKTQTTKFKQELLDFLDEKSPDPLEIITVFNEITHDIISSMRRIKRND